MTRILAFAAQYRAWLIGAAILAFTHAGAFGFGVLHAERGNARQAVAEAKVETTEAKRETVAVIQHNDAQTAQRIEVKVRDLARERQLAAERDQLRDQRDLLQRALDEKPDLDPDCRVSTGDLRMLNAAARPSGGDATSGASDPAVFAAYQEQTPSTVSCRAFVSGELDIRHQYNDLAIAHDRLIDWIEQEVIEPQVALDAPSDNQ